jgi:uncharacterized protein YxeA
MNFLNNIKGHIVFDMDEILVDIFPTVFEFYMNNTDRFQPYMRSDSPYTKETINQRADHDIRHLLLKDEYRSLSYDQIKEILAEMFNFDGDRDLWSLDMYQGLTPTRLGKAVMDPSFIDREDILSVTILTFSSSETLNDHKRRYKKLYFNHPKITLVPVNGFGRDKMKKSDMVKKLGMEWDAFIDDMPYNIKDFVENFEDIRGKKLYSPLYGYNKLSDEFIKKIEEKGGTFEYYIP